MKKVIVILLVQLAVAPCRAPASTSQETTGARPAAMAGAFVGVADDGNALYWNPAGMAFLNHHEITSMHCDLFGLGISNDYLAYTYPLTSRLAVGLDWFNLGFSDPELEYSFNKFNFGGSYKITSRASLGLILKHLNTSTKFDARSLGHGRGWTGDIGMLYKVADNLSAGATFNNIFNVNRLNLV